MKRNLFIFLLVLAVSFFTFRMIQLTLRDFKTATASGVFSINREQRQAEAERLQKALWEAGPVRKAGGDDPDIAPRAAAAFLADETGELKTLFSLRSDTSLPIASLSKLMTALATVKHIPLDERILVSEESVAQEGEMGYLRAGETLTVRDLLYPLLMESSNDAAAALAQNFNEGRLVDLMNEEAENLGLVRTNFVNPTGLDEDPGRTNMSSARDVAFLLDFLYRKHSGLFNILSLSSFDLFRPDGTFHHRLANTNHLLENESWPTKVLGGKTGWTKAAKGNLVLMMSAPKDRGRVIYVVIGSDDRFGEMRRIIEWTHSSYRW